MSEARLVQLLCQYGTLPWVHYESSEEVRPCDVVHRILFRGDSSSNNLCVHVIRQHLEKTKHCSGRTENETSICGIKFLVYILVTSQIYCMNCHRCLRDSVSWDQFSRDQLPPDQLSWDQLATRSTLTFAAKDTFWQQLRFKVCWLIIGRCCWRQDLVAIDLVRIDLMKGSRLRTATNVTCSARAHKNERLTEERVTQLLKSTLWAISACQGLTGIHG